MSDSRDPIARPADAESLARELVSALAAMSTPPPGGPASSFAGAGAPAAPTVSFAGPRQILENAARFVSPHLPADARMRSAKALVLRALRIVTRDQTVFNSALFEALRSALVELEGALSAQAARAAEEGAALQALGERVNAELPELRDRQDRDARRAEERLAVLSATHAEALRREAAAREALGRELLASQRRVDGLETDRDARTAATERRLDALEASARAAEALAEQVRLLRLEWSSLRGSLAERPRVAVSEAAPTAASMPSVAPSAAHAGVYAQFEETFRGSEGEIRERQRKDVTLFPKGKGPVADLGCGRGEFLEVLREAGLEGVGCDSNPVMVARAKEKGLAVAEADLFSWLAARPDGSLGGVAAYQVVEHLPATLLLPLVELAARKLAPGGRLLLETINPESVYAMRWFWMDLTHVRPVPAPSLSQLLASVGFRDVEVRFRSPVPPGDALPPGSDPALEPVSRLLFGPQDYAVTGLK